MKQLFKSLLVAGSLVALHNNVFASSAILQLDPYHSAVEFSISHLGFSHPTGKWMVSGTLNLDEANFTNSSVNITIPVKEVVTGIPKLDEHLQTADFFDSAKYPTATFVSQKVSPLKDGKFTLTGLLTLHGVTKPVTLNAVQNKIAVHPMTKLKTAGFSATTTIKRSDWGISAYVPHLSDEVKLTIEVEANLVPEKK
jgi:polyisoprenoid-binding protein YceI